MQFPEIEDFMECFGMEPIEEDVEMMCFRYIKKSNTDFLEIDFSFSAMTDSFLVIFRHKENEITRIYSEKVKKIEIRKDKFSSGIYIYFVIHGCLASANIILEPYLHCNWSILEDRSP